VFEAFKNFSQIKTIGLAQAVLASLRNSFLNPIVLIWEKFLKASNTL